MYKIIYHVALPKSLIFLILMVCIGLGVALFVFIRRYMWLKAQITYEMEDVKNLATTKNIEMNYQGFNE